MDINIRFQVNPKTIYREISTEEWEAMERAQDGKPRIYQLRPILARYVIDEEGKRLTQDQGMELMRKLPILDFLQDVFPAFFQTLRDGAVPKANGAALNSPSPANTPQTATPPDGLQPS
jgi:hypothetical protein